MLVMKRPGSFVALGNESMRVQVTLPAAASPFFVTKTRPVPVAAQIVPVSLGARAAAEGVEPMQDSRIATDFRRHLVSAVTLRALQRSLP